MSPRNDEFLDDDERAYAPPSIFASGWFRAVLVLGALAVILVIGVPYAMRWLEPGTPPREAQVTRPAAPPVEPKAPAAPEPSTATPAPAPAPTPAAPAPTPAPPVATAPPAAVQPAPTPAPAPAPAELPRKAEKRAEPKPEPKAAEKAPRAERAAKADAPKAAKADPPAPARAAEKKPAPEPPAVAKAEPSAAPAASASGNFWVQVGLFQEPANAQRLSTNLREHGFTAQVTTVTRGAAAAPAPAAPTTPAPAAAAPGSRHEVFVAGASLEAVRAALRDSGTARAVEGGVVVQPPMELKDAVALSRRLAGEGLNVSIRRVAGPATPSAPAPAAPAPSASPAPSGSTVHLVRVGGFATRADAQTARRALESKGIAGFITEGTPK